MSVKDVIKKSILESDMYNQAIDGSTIMTILVDVLVAVVIGMLIYSVYKHFFRGVVYSRSFAFTLVGMTILTCVITLAISTNIVISLGMVGALSIVRFRTAIKEPMDLLYLFWAITSGIASGASMYILLAISTVVMIIVIAIFSKPSAFGREYIMIVNYTGETAGDEIIRELSKQKYQIRSKILRGENTELTIQLKVRNGNESFVDRINEMKNVKDVSMIQFDGEYHS